MAKNTASEKALGTLHQKVAEVLTEQVGRTQNVVEYDSDGNMFETDEIEFCASPATIATAVKFLKDNNITSDIEVDQNTQNLKGVLERKQKHSRLANAAAAAREGQLQ